MVKYYIVPFLLPPGSVVLLLALAGLWFLARRNALAGFVNLVLAALLWGISSAPVSDRLMGALEAPYYTLPEPRGDAIVLLGGGVFDGAPDLSGKGAPSGEMLSRMATAVRLQKKLGVPVIVSGGKVFESRSPEAPIVRRFLVDLGVPPGKILLDDRSRDTVENARNACRICTERGFRAPIVVTSAYHMRRAVLSIEKAGMKAMPFPAGFRTWPGKTLERADYFPDAASLASTAAAVREYIGLFVYRVAY